MGFFGSDKTEETVVETIQSSLTGIGEFVDESFFTAEEKSKANVQLLHTRLGILEKTADESTVRSISRRVIALSITFTFLFLIVCAAYGTIYEATWVKDMLLILSILENPFLAVISFYFVVEIGNSWILKAKKPNQ